MNRRGFFRLLAGAPLAAGAAVAIARPATSGIAIVRSGLPFVADGAIYSEVAQSIIERAMRILGVMGPGETLCRSQMEACRSVLANILARWDATPQLGPVSFTDPFTVNLLGYELAGEMAPEFDTVAAERLIHQSLLADHYQTLVRQNRPPLHPAPRTIGRDRLQLER